MFIGIDIVSKFTFENGLKFVIIAAIFIILLLIFLQTIMEIDIRMLIVLILSRSEVILCFAGSVFIMIFIAIAKFIINM